MDIVRAKIFEKFRVRIRRFFAGRRFVCAPQILGELGVEAIFAMPGAATDALFAAARRARRTGRGGSFPRVRALEPGTDSVFEVIRFAFENDGPIVIWLAPGPEGLVVLPALRTALRSRIPLLLVLPGVDGGRGQGGVPGGVEFDREDTGRRRLPFVEILRPFCKDVHVIRDERDSESFFEEVWSSVTAAPAGPVLIELQPGSTR